MNNIFYFLLIRKNILNNSINMRLKETRDNFCNWVCLSYLGRVSIHNAIIYYFLY